MKALRFSRNEGRYAAAMLASRLRSGAGAAVGGDVVAGDDGLFLVQGRGLSLYLPYAAFRGPDEVAAVESMYCQSAGSSENEKSQWG